MRMCGVGKVLGRGDKPKVVEVVEAGIRPKNSIFFP